MFVTHFFGNNKGALVVAVDDVIDNKNSGQYHHPLKSIILRTSRVYLSPASFSY